MAADGHGKWFADDHGKGRRVCQPIHGDVPIGCGR